jgi:nucleolin
VARIFIGNLSYNADSGMITEAASAAGIVLRDVRIILDKETQRPRGFGFAEVDDATRAIEVLNGLDIDGRRIRVDMAAKQEDRPRRDPGRDSNRAWDDGGRPRRDRR